MIIQWKFEFDKHHIQTTILQPKYSEHMRQQKIAESGLVGVDWIVIS